MDHVCLAFQLLYAFCIKSLSQHNKAQLDARQLLECFLAMIGGLIFVLSSLRSLPTRLSGLFFCRCLFLGLHVFHGTALSARAC